MSETQYGHIVKHGTCHQYIATDASIAEKVYKHLITKGIELDHGKCPARYSVLDYDSQRMGYYIKTLSEPRGARQSFTFEAAAEGITLDLEAVKDDDSTYHYITRDGTCYLLHGFSNPALIKSYGEMQRSQHNIWGKGACPDYDFQCYKNGTYTLMGDTFTSSYCKAKRGVWHEFSTSPGPTGVTTCYQEEDFTSDALKEADMQMGNPKEGACPKEWSKCKQNDTWR